MLAEEKFREIQKYVESHGTVTVQELTDLLNTSNIRCGSIGESEPVQFHKRIFGTNGVSPAEAYHTRQ